MNDPRGIPALIKTINDYADILHSDLSFSSYELARQGARALPAVAPLLDSDDEAVRWKALWIIQQVTGPMPEASRDRQFVDTLANFDPGASKKDRKEGAAKIEKWIADHTRGSKKGE
jgi:hypothetical protein